jgi:predicted permease
MNWWQRLFRKQEQENRLDRELQFHFDCRVADHVRAGMSESEARRRARIELGGLEQAKQECRESRGTATVDTTLQDARFSLRILRKSPAFTLAAIGTLALGIGANTAIFQLLDAVRLRSLPVPNPQQLVRIQIRGGNRGFGISNDSYNLTYPLLEQLRRHPPALSGVFGWGGDQLQFGQGPGRRRVRVLRVSGEFFSTLQLTPAAGRLLTPDDDQRGCTLPAVVLSYPFWQSEFAGRASVIGSKVTVQDRLFAVIGVTPARFSGLQVGDSFDLGLPMCASPGPELRRDYFWVTVMARLKPGVAIRQASDQLSAVSPGMAEATLPPGYSSTTLENYRKFRLEAAPAANGVSRLRDQYDTSLWLLLGATGLVLLIACANLGNLMLARSGSRQREYAVRLALGAPRLRLIRQSLCESLILAVAGAAAGLVLAGLLSKTILWFLSTGEDAPLLDLSMDWRMLAFTAAVATLACVVFGVVPALRASQTDPGTVIKSGGRLTEGRDSFSFQRLLAVVQISVSLVLVVGALLFVGSFRNLMNIDLGFRAKGILLAAFDMTRLHLPQPEIKGFQRQLLEEVRSIPQVDAAATTTNTLIGGGSWTLGVRAGAVDDSSKFTWISPGHFRALETPILAGRDFNANDTEISPKVAIVNQTFARRFFASASPLGKTLLTVAEPNYPATEYQIVGLIKDTKYYDLRSENPPICYALADQFPEPGPWSQMYIRSSAPLTSIRSAIQRRLTASHPELEMEFLDFQKQIGNTLVRERLMAALSGLFGALAVLLATIGLYGVISYVVVRRRNEIGIRMAVGATRTQVVGLILKDAAVLVLMGVAIGVPCSLALGKTTASLLFGLKPYDPLTLLAGTILLAAVAALGSYLPARRAARLDPMMALRYE